MPTEADIEACAAALEMGDNATVRTMLQGDPALARATLPDGWPMFLLQSTWADPDLVALMVAHGADPDARSPSGETLLHLSGDPEVIRKLVALGADINARDQRGHTALMAHAPHPQTGPDAIHALLALGADPGVIGHAGETAASLLPEGPAFARLRQQLASAS